MFQQRLNCLDKHKADSGVHSSNSNNIANTHDNDHGHNNRDDDDDDDDVAGCDFSKTKVPEIWRKEDRIIKKGTFCPAIDQVLVLTQWRRLAAGIQCDQIFE